MTKEKTVKYTAEFWFRGDADSDKIFNEIAADVIRSCPREQGTTGVDGGGYIRKTNVCNIRRII